MTPEPVTLSRNYETFFALRDEEVAPAILSPVLWGNPQ